MIDRLVGWLDIPEKIHWGKGFLRLGAVAAYILMAWFIYGLLSVSYPLASGVDRLFFLVIAGSLSIFVGLALAIVTGAIKWIWNGFTDED